MFLRPQAPRAPWCIPEGRASGSACAVLLRCLPDALEGRPGPRRLPWPETVAVGQPVWWRAGHAAPAQRFRVSGADPQGTSLQEGVQARPTTHGLCPALRKVVSSLRAAPGGRLQAWN